MLDRASSYDSLVSGFSWLIPERCNMGVAVCDIWANVEPDRPAIISCDDANVTSTTSFGTLKRLSNRLANVLTGLGLRPGDRAAIILPQSVETITSHIAIYKAGGVAVPLALLFGPDALSYRLQNSGTRFVITNREGLEKLSEIRSELPDLDCVLLTGDQDDEAVSFEDACARARDDFTAVATGPDSPALMIYTSGTTGLAKGALHGHRVLWGHLPGVQMAHEFFPHDGDLFWTPADWAWAGGLLNALLPSLYFGVPVLARKFEKFDPEAALDLMARQNVRNAFIPPTALKLLKTIPDPRADFDLRLRSVMSAGESLGRETYDWSENGLGLRINEAYGQTECNLVLGSMAGLGISRSGAIGKAVPGHQVAIIDDDGQRCSPGEVGQIAVARPDPVMFLEYWNRPDATEDKFVDDWMQTGDQGFEDEDGYIHFVGRDDDVITSAGYRIGPGEVEDCLIAHPAVALAAVVGKPDPVRTEIVKACIVLKPGVEESTALVEDIQEHVKRRLAAYEYPREIVFLQNLPMTTTGKIIRRLLRD
ncbi:acyl-CoA synthetase [Coralliovum pocilloporae]|uniref:acyl-CoA synthetase n=1 Tax=Coralliovum pocilloporae TaxID=3066369 RepID=UPI0033070577